MTIPIISNEEVKNVMKLVKSFEQSGLLPDGAIKTFENETKQQKVGFFVTFLGTLAASLLANTLSGKAKITGGGVIKAGKETIGAGQDF